MTKTTYSCSDSVRDLAGRMRRSADGKVPRRILTRCCRFHGDGSHRDMAFDL